MRDTVAVVQAGTLDVCCPSRHLSSPTCMPGVLPGISGNVVQYTRIYLITNFGFCGMQSWFWQQFHCCSIQSLPWTIAMTRCCTDVSVLYTVKSLHFALIMSAVMLLPTTLCPAVLCICPLLFSLRFLPLRAGVQSCMRFAS